jgi:hypothetical protein
MNFYQNVKALYESTTDPKALKKDLGVLLAAYDQEISLPDFAEAAGMNPRTVSNWISGGKIEAVNRAVDGKKPRWFIRMSELSKIQQ